MGQWKTSTFKDIETAKVVMEKVEKTSLNVQSVKDEEQSKNSYNSVLECILRLSKNVVNVKDKVR